MGTVYLVGAGPGDPRLITLRGHELLRRADVVLHDALVDPRLLRLPPAEARVVDVGRRANEARPWDQDAITRRLIDLSLEHRVVVRLKGGDPFVFGRGGEEGLALAEAGVPFEVVPGITSGVGVPGCAGIPLTHRGVAGSVLFATPPRGDGEEAESEWRRIAASGDTVVLFMAGRRLAETGERLIRHGRRPGEPAAAVEWGTLSRQRVTVDRLDRLAERVGRPFTGPVLVVVGDVVGLREQLLRGGDGRPVPARPASRARLAGHTILLARARPHRSRIAERLERLGADVIEHPTVHSVVNAGTEGLAAAVSAQAPGSAVVFTGSAPVRALARALRREGRDARVLAGSHLVGVGAGAAAALRRSNLGCDCAVRAGDPADVFRALRRRAGALEGRSVLVVHDGHEVSALERALEATGAELTSLMVAERTVDVRGRRSLERLLTRGEVDWVVLPSSSAAQALASAGPRLPPDVPVLAMGRSTAATARALGFSEPRVPEAPGTAGLIAAFRTLTRRRVG